MRALFQRRKSEPAILAAHAPPDVSQSGNFVPAAEFSAQVFYLGHHQISDSKAVSAMLGTIRELKRRRKTHKKPVDFSLFGDVIVVRESIGVDDRPGAVFFQTPLANVAMCMQESTRRTASSDHFAVNVTARGIAAPQHYCHVFQAKTTSEVSKLFGPLLETIEQNGEAGPRVNVRQFS